MVGLLRPGIPFHIVAINPGANMLRAAFVVFAALALSGCSSASEMISESPSAAGTIASINILNEANSEVRLLLDPLSIKPELAAGPSIYLNVDKATKIYVRDSGGRLRAGTIGDLAVGLKVVAKVDGTVFDTLPSQYGALVVEIAAR